MLINSVISFPLMKKILPKNIKSSIFIRFYLRICINMIELLENIINNQKLLFLYSNLYHVKYLYPYYSLIVNIIPYVYLLSYYKLLIFSDLKIAFIADGNRRYLKKLNKNIEEVKKEGLLKINEMIEFSNFFNISEVGFFCLSINNLKRSTEELSNILQIFNNKKEIKGCVIKIYGNLDLLPEESKSNLKYLESSTKNNKGVIVNLFTAYSSKEEIENKIRFSGNVDLVIRTSGEKRLSDFLILQCCKGSNIFFCDVLWPEITKFHVWLIILKYKLENLFFYKF